MTHSELSRVSGAVTPLVHPTASVDQGAEIGPGVRIGPHVVIQEWTALGRDCRVYTGAALGGVPQDRHFKGERSYLRIGDRVTLREYVSVSRATGEEAQTVIGDDTMMM